MKNILRKIFLIPIHFYRKFISPLKPPCCRYYPTCSTYAVQAVERFGIIRGTMLAAWRILRCNPWSKGGIDYVPQEFPLKSGKREKKKY
jgi:putative membrane protein insertion efficiency factor